MRDIVEILVRNLLNSAQARGTNQGVFVFKKSIQLLTAARSDKDVLEILRKLNKATTGIYAHGYFTQTEQEWVNELWSEESRAGVELNSQR
jgi:hypothetical protein